MPESSAAKINSFRTLLEPNLPEAERSLFFENNKAVAARSTIRLRTLNDPHITRGVELYNKERGLTNPEGVIIAAMIIEAKDTSKKTQTYQFDWKVEIFAKQDSAIKATDYIELVKKIVDETNNKLGEKTKNSSINPLLPKYDLAAALVSEGKWQAAIKEFDGLTNGELARIGENFRSRFPIYTAIQEQAESANKVKAIHERAPKGQPNFDRVIEALEKVSKISQETRRDVKDKSVEDAEGKLRIEMIKIGQQILKVIHKQPIDL